MKTGESFEDLRVIVDDSVKDSSTGMTLIQPSLVYGKIIDDLNLLTRSTDSR